MVRGLVTRRVFVLLDLLLVIFCLATFTIVGMRSLASGEVLTETPMEDGGVNIEPMKLASVGGLADYNAIKSSGIFGPAGSWEPGAEPPPPAVVEISEEDISETKLNLTLHGVVALEPDSPFSSAVIEDRNIRDSSRVFFQGEEITPQVELVEVHARWVILLNRREIPPLKERLSMDEEEEGMKLASAGPSQTPDLRTTTTERINLNRSEVMKDLEDSYADLITKIKPELVRDNNGEVLGITAKNIGTIPLAEKLGISEGDVLQTVNNEKIDSQQKIMEMVQKYQNASSFRIGIQRGGKPKIITYRLN